MKEKIIVVAEMPVLVWWKRIKNMNLSVKGPDGLVRISVPLSTSEKRVRQMVVARMSWIEKQQARVRRFDKPEVLHAVTGEKHLFFGEMAHLQVIYGKGRHHVIFDGDNVARLYVRPETTREKRLQVIHDWYRAELALRIPDLVVRWQDRIGEQVNEWRIKRMKTRWGTCNIDKRRIWLNLELARKPEVCLEYIVVHEMVHLLERGHTRRFYQHLDRLLPQWKDIDILLKTQ